MNGPDGVVALDARQGGTVGIVVVGFTLPFNSKQR